MARLLQTCFPSADLLCFGCAGGHFHFPGKEEDLHIPVAANESKKVRFAQTPKSPKPNLLQELRCKLPKRNLQDFMLQP